jgi:hypothetical protein
MNTGEPKRVSALNSLAKCPGLVAARTALPSESGKAADTGTAVGRGIELWHKGMELTPLLLQVGEEQASHPKADWEAVAKTVTGYCNDPRNPPDVVVPDSLELEVTLRLEPDEDDPTGKPIVLVGHTDQVRYAYPDHPDRENLGLLLFDVKNGRASGDEMVMDYAYQLAAYTVALESHYGVGEVMTGGIIRTKGYLSKVKDATTGKLRRAEPGEHRVFHHAGWTIDTCHAILGNVRYLIGQVRAGVIVAQPGAHCRYCPLDFPHCTSGELARVLLDNHQA